MACNTRSSTSPGVLIALYNTDENNSMTAYQITTARNKYWIPYRFDGTSFIELDAVQLGDVNGDGTINITDVTILINQVMNN